MSGQRLSTGMAFTDSTLSPLRPNPIWVELLFFGQRRWKRSPFGKIAERTTLKGLPVSLPAVGKENTKMEGRRNAN